jgi:hypothetical protein
LLIWREAVQTGHGMLPHPSCHAPAACKIFIHQLPAKDRRSAETVPPALDFRHDVNPWPPPAPAVNSIQGREIQLH